MRFAKHALTLILVMATAAAPLAFSGPSIWSPRLIDGPKPVKRIKSIVPSAADKARLTKLVQSVQAR